MTVNKKTVKNSHLRIIWNMASHAQMCDKKAFPRPCEIYAYDQHGNYSNGDF